jgi:hypothetical protein
LIIILILQNSKKEMSISAELAVRKRIEACGPPDTIEYL